MEWQAVRIILRAVASGRHAAEEQGLFDQVAARASVVARHIIYLRRPRLLAEGQAYAMIRGVTGSIRHHVLQRHSDPRGNCRRLPQARHEPGAR